MPQISVQCLFSHSHLPAQMYTAHLPSPANEQLFVFRVFPINRLLVKTPTKANGNCLIAKLSHRPIAQLPPCLIVQFFFFSVHELYRTTYDLSGSSFELHRTFNELYRTTYDLCGSSFELCSSKSETG